jgi:AcrR family transcriptional regulator
LSEKPYIPGTPETGLQFDDESTQGFTPKQRELLEAALRVMNRKGYDGCRTREIAAEAGVSEATLFKHFPTKRHILNALIQPFMVTVIKPTMIASVKELISANEGQPMELTLREIVRDRLSLFRSRRSLITTLVLEAIRHPDLMQVVREHVLPEIMGILDRVLDAARSRGEVRDIDRTVFIRSFMSLVVGHVAISSILPDELGSENDETASDQIVGLFVHGIGAARSKEE